MNGAATLGSGGVALTGGYISTNMPMSLLSGKSFTMEVLATNTSPGGAYQQLVGNNNDYKSFWGKYGGQGQLYHQNNGDDGLASFGSGRDDDFVNDGQIHRYVIRLDTTVLPNFEIYQFVDGKTPVGSQNFAGFRLDPNASQMEIGGENGGANAYSGAIYRVRISDNAVASADFIAVPEPTSLAMLGTSLLLLNQRRRRV